jgi:hypothetical protein
VKAPHHTNLFSPPRRGRVREGVIFTASNVESPPS